MSDSSHASHRSIGSAPLLVGGVLTSVAASVCCIGPLLLLATGISGAWMSRLMVLEPYYPILAIVSLAFIGAAGWKLLQPGACAIENGQAALALPATKSLVVFAMASSLAVILLTSEYWIVLLAG